MDKFRHVFQDFVIIDEKIWFCSSVINGIFCANIDGGHAEFVALFPEDDLFQSRLYTEVYAYGERLIFIPYHAEKISIYNILENSFIHIELSVNKKKRQGKPFVTFQWKNKVYLLNDGLQSLIILNAQKGTIQEKYIPILPKRGRYSSIKCIVGNCAYIVIENKLIIISLENEKIELKEIAQPDVQLVGIINEDNNFWLIDRSNKLYLYQIDAEEIMFKTSFMDLQWCDPSFLIKDMFRWNHIMYLLVNKEKCIIRLRLPSMDKEIISINAYNSENAYIEYVYHAEDKNLIHFLLRGEDRHQIWNMETRACKKIYYETLLAEIHEMYYKHSKQCNRDMRESNIGKGLEVLKIHLNKQRVEKNFPLSIDYGKEIWKRTL